MSSLRENLNSDYFKAFNSMTQKNAPTRIFVYVESYDDIVFWQSVLDPFESSKLVFEINTPVSSSSAKGKNAALKKRKGALATNRGEYLIVCVDSDLDYLLPEKTETAMLINNDPHIFQTYAYSIENYQCFPDSLKRLVVKITRCDESLINFNKLLIKISEIIYPLFILLIYFHKNNNEHLFPISQFSDTIKIFTQKSPDELDSTLLEMQEKVDRKCSELRARYAIDNTDDIVQYITQFGVTVENVYLFIHGHTLFSNIVLMVLKPLCKKLYSDNINLIKETTAGAEKTNALNHYNNEIGKYKGITIEKLTEKALRDNTDFKNCFLYKKIESDISQFLSTFNNSL